MKSKTILKLTVMIKKVIGGVWFAACMLALALICAPCLLIFSTGLDGEMTWLNWFGIGWLLMLIIVFKKIG